MIFILTTVTFWLSALLTLYFSRPETFLLVLDKPNARSLHTSPIPINGGIAILIALTTTVFWLNWYYLPMQKYLWIFGSGLLIAIVSFIDDCRHVNALYRLLVHFFAAYLLLWQTDLWLIQLTLPGFTWVWASWWQIGISGLFIVWMVNLYNFMDGMDGLAGGMAVFGFGTLAIFGWLAEQQLFMVMNMMVASAVGGFLIFNFPPARIFMGDVGSSSLGFLAATFGLWGSCENIIPLWIVLLLFSPFIVDATVTLLWRLLRGEKIWLAHKSHHYQRLVQIGWGHKRTVLWEYALMVMCSCSALLAPLLPVYGQWSLIIGWNCIYIGLIYLVVRLDANRI